MDDFYGQAGFTIPAEVNVRLLPPQQSRSAGRDRLNGPRDSGTSDIPALSPRAYGPRGPGYRHLNVPSDRAQWATPSISEARSSDVDTRHQSREPPSARLRDRVDDGRRDSATEAWIRGGPDQYAFTDSSERRQREVSERYSDYKGAATVMRDRQYAQSSTASYAAPQRKRLVTDQADYDIIKPLRPATHNRRQEELYLVEDCDTKELFVQKRFSMSTPSSRERAIAERNALWQIMNHETASAHIVQLIEAFYESGDAYSHLILEHCDSGTLEDFIYRYQREQKSTPEDFAWHVLASLASALCTCHYGVGHAGAVEAAPRDWRMLCHLDIRPGNVWLTSQQKVGAYPRVVLGGFELVATKEDVASRRAHEVVARCGEWEWMPPEGRFQRDDGDRSKLGSGTDIWQVGATIHALCCLVGVPRLEGVVDAQSVCGRDFSFALNNIVACCMQPEWRNRPNAVDLAKEVHREMLRRAQSKARRAPGGGYAVV